MSRRALAGVAVTGAFLLVLLNLAYLLTIGWHAAWWDFYYTRAEKTLALPGQLPQALKDYQEALRYAELMVPSDGRLARTYHDLGLVYWLQGQPAKASLYFERAQALFTRYDGPDSYFVGVVLARRGEMAMQQGDISRGEALLRRASAILNRTVGAHDSLAIRSRASLGLALLYLGRRTEARTELIPVANEVRGNDKIGDIVYQNQVTNAVRTLRELR